ncbi:MAG: hypothetical protein ACE5GA_03570 [Candidatus Zixiibacteriota bacterium]
MPRRRRRNTFVTGFTGAFTETFAQAAQSEFRRRGNLQALAAETKAKQSIAEAEEEARREDIAAIVDTRLGFAPAIGEGVSLVGERLSTLEKDPQQELLRSKLIQLGTALRRQKAKPSTIITALEKTAMFERLKSNPVFQRKLKQFGDFDTALEEFQKETATQDKTEQNLRTVQNFLSGVERFGLEGMPPITKYRFVSAAKAIGGVDFAREALNDIEFEADDGSKALTLALSALFRDGERVNFNALDPGQRKEIIDDITTGLRQAGLTSNQTTTQALKIFKAFGDDPTKQKKIFGSAYDKVVGFLSRNTTSEKWKVLFGMWKRGETPEKGEFKEKGQSNIFLPSTRGLNVARFDVTEDQWNEQVKIWQQFYDGPQGRGELDIDAVSDQALKEMQFRLEAFERQSDGLRGLKSATNSGRSRQDKIDRLMGGGSLVDEILLDVSQIPGEDGP